MHKDVTLNLEDFCGHCGRHLTDPESKRRGLGPVCYNKPTDSRHQKREGSPTSTPMDHTDPTKEVELVNGKLIVR